MHNLGSHLSATSSDIISSKMKSVSSNIHSNQLIWQQSNGWAYEYSLKEFLDTNPLEWLNINFCLNGPYSLLDSGCYIYFSSVHVRFASAIFTVCKWRWWCRMFLLRRASAVRQQRCLIIRGWGKSGTGTGTGILGVKAGRGRGPGSGMRTRTGTNSWVNHVLGVWLLTASQVANMQLAI